MKKVLKSMFLLMVAGLYTATSWADSLIARWDNFTGLTSDNTLAPTASATVNDLNGSTWTFNLGGGTVTDGVLATGTTTAPKIDFGGTVDVSRDKKPITVLVAVQLPLTPTADKPFFHICNGSTGYGLVSVSSNKVAASWGNSAWNSSSKQATIDMSASKGTVYLVYSVANGSMNASVTSVTLDTTSYSWQTFSGLTGTGVNANQITFGNFVNATSGGLNYNLKSVAVFNGAFAPLVDIQSVIRGWEGVVENDVTATLSGNSTWGNVAWDNAPNNLSNVTLTVDAASTLTMSGETSILTLTANGSAPLTIAGEKLNANATVANTDMTVEAGAASLGGVTIVADKTLTVKDNATTTSVAGAGTLNLDVGASTTLENYALNAFTGTTKVSSGTLKYTVAANRPAGAILVSGENAVLQIAETTDILGYSGGLPGITIENGARFEAFQRDTFSRVLTLNNGKLVFNADNQNSNRSFDLYTNSKIVSSGNSTIGGANATNDSESGDPIVASGIIAIRRDNLEIEVADGTLNVYSTFKKEAGNGVVYKKGAGTMAVYRPATSALAVTVNAGELRLVRKGSLTTGAMTIDANATLTYVGDKAQGNTLTNNGAVVVEGEGSKLDLTGATLDGDGTYTAAAGTTLKLTLAQAKAVTLSIADGATLQVVLSDAEKLVAQEVPGVTKVVFVDAAGNALTEEGEEAGSNNTYAPAIPECVYAYVNGAWGWTVSPVDGAKVKVDFTGTENQTVDLATLWTVDAFSKLTITGAGTVTVNAANIADIAEVATVEGSTLAIAGTETSTTIATPITGAGKVALASGKIAIATAKSYTGGTDIAEGATVTVANATATLGTGAVTGAGTVVYTGALPPASAALSNAAWTGTVKIDAINAITDFDLTTYGNANSKIVLGNLGTSNTNLYFANDTKDVLSDIEIAGKVIFRNGYAAAAVNFMGAITGDGELTFPDTSKSFGTLSFYGDVSGFTGTINCPAGSATRKFVFCSNETTTTAFDNGVTVADNCALTVNATYVEPIKVIGTIKQGSGTLQNRVEFKNGATLDASEGPLRSGNEVWVATGTSPTVLLPSDAGEDTVVLTCTNANIVCNELTSSDSKWTFVADGNNIKLALAQVTITLPEISNAKWYYKGVEVVNNTIAVDPGKNITVTLQPGDLYVFADNAASKEVEVTVGDADVTVDAKDLNLPEVVAAGAKIGDEYYTTLAEAIENAQANDTITLLANVEASEIITIEKAITLDGNGKTLTSTATRAINVDCVGAVTIQNLTIKAKERAINIINKAATVTINGVTATADNVAVMIATSAGAAQVAIADSNLTGLMVVGVYGAEADVTIDGSTITNVDANKNENYGAITVGDTADKATVAVTNTTITVADDSKKVYNFAPSATITGVDEVGVVVAMIGDAGYDTIEEAADDVKAGQTIVLLTDVSTTTPLAIAGTIDLNGKKLTADIAGTIKMNNGTFATTQYTMVGADGKYTSTDAVFTIAANATYDMTVTAGTLTLNAAQWWTLEGQTITIGENAAIEIPAGKILGINGSTIVVNGTATVDGEVQLLTKTSTVTAADADLNVTTSVDGCEVAYVDGVYRVAVVITIPEEIYTSTNIPEEVKQALAEAMVEQGVTEIETYTITTKGEANSDADAADVAAVLEVFEVTPTVDEDGELSVAYEFGISKVKNIGNGKVEITAGVTGAEYRAGVTVTFYAGTDVIGTATTTADSTTVSITDIDAATLDGKKITVKAKASDLE